MTQSRIRGALIGSIIGDCLGGIHDTLPQSFAEAAARADPHSLKGKLVRSGDRHIFRFSADSLGIFAATQTLLTTQNPEKFGEDFRASLISSFAERRGVKKAVPTSLLIASLADNPEIDVEKFRLSGNCAVIRAIPCGLINPSLAATLAATTHTHPSALDASLALALYINQLVKLNISHSFPTDATATWFPTEHASASLKKKVEIAIEMIKRVSHEDDEETEELQTEFRRRVGFNASASVAVASGVFGVLKAEHTMANLALNVVELPPHLKTLRAGDRSKNLHGNSNRLDSSRALDREDPFIETDSPFVMAVNWALSLGGDTRTNACVAGALAGARWGEAAIPDVWQVYCEGVDVARDLADQIAQRS